MLCNEIHSGLRFVLRTSSPQLQLLKLGLKPLDSFKYAEIKSVVRLDIEIQYA